MHKTYLGYLLKKGDTELLPLIHEFNTLPTRYMHRSWLEGVVDAGLFERLQSHPAAERKLAKHMLAHYGLADDFCYNFEASSRRLALFAPENLIQSAKLAGIALNAPKIQKVILKHEVLAMRRDLGDDGYQFALKKASFLLGNLEFPVPRQTDDQTLAEYTDACGKHLLNACFYGEPTSVIQRLQFKFPKGEGLDLDPSQRVSDKQRAWRNLKKESAWRIIKKILTHEVNPQWAPLLG
ncbi:SctK family type III secretion system sorting platform protein [Acanthopleuribacter pedis]|uniref:SctK family type III secretion system sorting platform protein n=1 Tax=Acanthopleuribacter pedis TaxID=442870 RepID=A0A8J7U5I3_9BACT|nr:SctK family type III secretion system sorting platform protein [Acanthopleuribacter pedis]MBO1322593.1 SctK family type III secretion system sorting platform protein [Acanthopleuribacter pedis]